jgi:hypothetical protein
MQVTPVKSEISVASNESFVIETAPEEDIMRKFSFTISG